MIGAIQGAYSSHFVSNSNLNSKLNLDNKVLPVNSQTTNQIQPANLKHPLDSQPASPVSYSNTSTTQQTNNADKPSQSDQVQVQAVINQLKARDSEVRAHEMAHLATAGGYARGGMSFTYQTGPDGKNYAIGGEVGIDTSPISGDPEATMQKAMIIQRAALAPAEPSAQDYKVAQAAMQMMAQARIELSQQNIEKQNEVTEKSEEGNQANSQNLSAEDNGSNQPMIDDFESALNLLTQNRQQFDLRLLLADSVSG